MKYNTTTLFILIIIYFFLKYYIPFWEYLIYPINLLVTFLHEFWHAFFALITGWSVISLVVNSDWSGLTTTSWGINDMVVAWWYLWSAIFWNILLYIWFKYNSPLSKNKLSEHIIFLLSGLMLFSGIFWFNGFISLFILITLAGWLFSLAKYTKYDNLVLQFLWVSSILFIIEDFNVWPTSDLKSFSWLLPSSVWMVIWLIFVLFITWYNLKLIILKNKK